MSEFKIYFFFWTITIERVDKIKFYILACIAVDNPVVLSYRTKQLVFANVATLTVPLESISFPR